MNRMPANPLEREGVSTFSEVEPIFVVGSPRSGTSLLRTMLNEYSNVAIAGELHFFDLQLKVREKVPDLSSDEAIERAVKLIADIPNLKYLPYLNRLLEGAVGKLYRSSVRSYELLYKYMLEEYALWCGKVRVGEKTPQYIRHLEALFATFPNARVIHIHRDPRDVVASLTEVPWASPDVVTNCLKWKAEMQTGFRWKDDPRVVVIKYEELVQSPSGSLRRLCQSVDLAYKDRAGDGKSLDTSVDFEMEPWKKRVQEKVTRSSVGSWIDRIGRLRGLVVQQMCRREMKSMSYDEMPVPVGYRILTPVIVAVEVVRWLVYKGAKLDEARGGEQRAVQGNMRDALRLLMNIFKQ